MNDAENDLVVVNELARHRQEPAFTLSHSPCPHAHATTTTNSMTDRNKNNNNI